MMDTGLRSPFIPKAVSSLIVILPQEQFCILSRGFCHIHGMNSCLAEFPMRRQEKHSIGYQKTG